MITRAFLVLFMVPGLCQTSISQPTRVSESPLVLRVDSCLTKLVQMQEEIKDIHPYLSLLHPVAVVERDDLYIFDVDSGSGTYRLQQKGPSPFPMPKGIRASFPLAAYGGKPSCVISPDVFDEPAGYTTIFHEFIHCVQSLTVEPVLKQNLNIAQQAARSNDYSWEINHAFPYQDSVFIRQYTSFLAALGKGDQKSIDESMSTLRGHLARPDYEYMVWEEWKEGFARFIENKVRARLGMPANRGGAEPPYNRVTFYYGGDLFIGYLVWKDEDLLTDMEKLFAKILGQQGE